MSDQFSSIEAKVRAAMSAPDPDPQFVKRLEMRLLASDGAAPAARPAARTRFPGRVPRPVWTAGLVALALLIVFLAVGPQRVLAAVRGWLGYVPGIGFVRTESELRVLVGPVEQQRVGITMKVEQVVADATRTVLVYTVEGLGPQHRPGGEDAPRCIESPRLRLLDGSELTMTGGESQGWPSGYQSRSIYPPLPEGQYAAILVIACLDDTRPGAAPEGWVLPLALQPAPPDFQPLPVIERAQSPAAPTNAAAPVAAQSTEAANLPPAADPHGMALTVERLVTLEDGFLLQGSFDWSQSAFEMPAFDSYSLVVTDGRGQRVPAEPEDSGSVAADPAVEKRYPWVLRTAAGAYPGPLTVTLPQITIDEPVDVPFEVDLGPEPQPGTTWELNRTLDIDGRRVTFIDVRLTGPGEIRGGSYALMFTSEVDPAALQSVSFWDPDNQSTTLSGGGGGDSQETLHQSINYDYLPTGVRRMVVNHIAYSLPGPWSATVDLPTAAAQSAGALTALPPADPSQACLTLERVEELKAAPRVALPPGLGGRVLAEGPVVTRPNFSFATLYAANLDGAQKITVGPGGWADLSPDGRRVVYTDADGSYITDLDSGQKIPLQWPPEDVYQFLWSPDGERLAFVNSGDGIYVSRLDGSEMQKIPNTGVSTFLAGWLPDGKSLVITELGAQGSVLKTVDVQTGAATERFTIDNRKGGFVVPSPDGRQVAFSEMVFGQPSYGLFVANLDGSGKRLVASMGLMAVLAGGWSADGRWLLVSVSEPGPVEDVTTSYLIQVDTCEVIPLPGIPSRVVSWR